jgi:predicted Rossmann fold flavoprotein
MDEIVYDLIVVGGGAAGFFGAIRTGELKPGSKILILEKTTKLLTKVKVSGGGRCNVTHDEPDPQKLSHHYPRGEKVLRSLFRHFHAHDVVQWFHSKNVPLKTEADGRMFPVTNDSQTIIDCFLDEVQKLKIRIETGKAVLQIAPLENRFHVACEDDTDYVGKKVLVALGGNPSPRAYEVIARLGHTIIKPIPSLFTFNNPDKAFTDLMGVAVSHAEVRIATTKFSNTGPVLITHWGLSGPAVIRLSAWAAAYLHEQNYQFTALVNWTGTMTEDTLRETLVTHKQTRGKQKVTTNPLFNLPQRLWERLCALAEIPAEKIWAELPQKNINKLLENLLRCPFHIKGKTTFKEEFVTCGGVDLSEIDLERMESKKIKGLHFAGEVLNIDGETGGFNFQAAWTTANTAAKAIIQI